MIGKSYRILFWTNILPISFGSELISEYDFNDFSDILWGK